MKDSIKNVLVRLDKEVWKRLKQTSLDEERPIQQIVEALIKEYLDE